MSEAELIEIVRGSNAQIAVLYGQLISINFAMVVATYYFLGQSRLVMKLLTYLIYLIGAGMFVGLMLIETNIRVIAMNALAGLESPSPVAAGIAAFDGSWLKTTTSVLLNLGIWLLVVAVTYLLFFWKRPTD